jgi:hypothetical protein
LQPPGLRDGFQTVARLADDLKLGRGVEQRAQPLAQDCVILDEQDAVLPEVGAHALPQTFPSARLGPNGSSSRPAKA